MSNASPPAVAWWRVPAGWLMVGGPLLVVVASFVTLAIAIRGGDVPLRDGVTAAKPTAAMIPATQARNHVVPAAR